jgi:hypothetical protein
MPKQLGIQFYTIKSLIYNSCCDETQFKYLCITCGETAGCYFCDFNPELKHEC